MKSLADILFGGGGGVKGTLEAGISVDVGAAGVLESSEELSEVATGPGGGGSLVSLLAEPGRTIGFGPSAKVLWFLLAGSMPMAFKPVCLHMKLTRPVCCHWHPALAAIEPWPDDLSERREARSMTASTNERTRKVDAVDSEVAWNSKLGRN